MIKIKVINIKNSKKYGRESFRTDRVLNHGSCNELYVFCGRPKKLSNPYEIGKDGNREEVIKKFRELANSESNINKEINNLANYAKKHKIKNLVLGCYCKPLACHCDVIKEVLDNKLNARLF